jgi:hypothetical protein
LVMKAAPKIQNSLPMLSFAMMLPTQSVELEEAGPRLKLCVMGKSWPLRVKDTTGRGPQGKV